MKRLTVAAAILPILAIGAAAQDIPVMKKLFPLPANVMGKEVKGAPYSADEITESLQVLADGTRISNQSQVTVYRDGEGRVRRESPTQITIWDPVANVSYTLDPKTMTAVKSSMGRVNYSFLVAQPPQKNTMQFYFSSDSASNKDLNITQEKAAADAQKVAATLDKLKAELDASQSGGMVVNGNPADAQMTAALKDQLAAAMQKAAKANGASPIKTEALGQQVMQGLTVEGTRTTSTIEAGTIGNDRPIQTVSDRWYSEELQTAVMTKRTDLRTGEETFRLANLHRGEPGADLFLLPPGYQLLDSAAPVTMRVAPVKKKE